MIKASDADTARRDFQCAVFEILNYHSLLDLNLGLCIAHLKNPDSPRSEYANLATPSCAAKIAMLRKLVSPEMTESLELWAQEASRVRALRNQFAHGVWEYLPARESEPIGLRMPPWFVADDDLKCRYSVSDIQSLAQEMKVCFDQFMSWRRAHTV